MHARTGNYHDLLISSYSGSSRLNLQYSATAIRPGPHHSTYALDQQLPARERPPDRYGHIIVIARESLAYRHDSLSS